MQNATAIIPARGGSKRIPGKNIRDFCGFPMIHWPIEAARKSGLFDRIIVSTDDPDIAQVARNAGAETPFMRGSDLADDHTGTTDVIRDAVLRLELPDETPVCALYATAAMTSATDLKQGLDQLVDGTDWVFSVGAFRAPIARAYRQKGAHLVPFEPTNMPKRSQDFDPAYFDAGQFYWAHAKTWTDPAARVWDGASGVILPPERCVDIDTEADWKLAEMLFRGLHETRLPG